jgi:small subunit ribosomal protein S17
MEKIKNKKNAVKITTEKTKMEKKINPRGRSFEGEIIKKFSDRIVIQFERLLYLRKYERYEKRKTKLQAKVPMEMQGKIQVGDYIEIKECKPISKSIHFIVIKKIRSLKNESNNSKSI